MSVAHTSKLDSIQALRGIAALAVALLHCAGLQVIEGLRTDTGIFENGWIGVDLFFILSGFIMVWVTQNVNPGVQTARRFLAMRIIRIYPLWITCAVLIGIAFMVIHGAPAHPETMDLSKAWPYFLRSLLLIPQDVYPVLNVGWTLIHEMFFYLIFAGFILLGLRRHLGLATLAWAGITIAGDYLGWREISPALNIIFHPLSLLFMLGMMIALCVQRLSNLRFGWVALALGVSGLVYLWGWGGVSSEHRVTQLAVPLGLIVYGVVSLERNGALGIPRILSWLGDISYSLYLTHPLTIIGWQVIVKPFYPSGPLEGLSASHPGIIQFLDFTLLLLACLIVAPVFYYCIERPSLKFLQRRFRTYRPDAP